MGTGDVWGVDNYNGVASFEEAYLGLHTSGWGCIQYLGLNNCQRGVGFYIVVLPSTGKTSSRTTSFNSGLDTNFEYSVGILQCFHTVLCFLFLCLCILFFLRSIEWTFNFVKRGGVIEYHKPHYPYIRGYPNSRGLPMGYPNGRRLPIYIRGYPNYRGRPIIGSTTYLFTT